MQKKSVLTLTAGILAGVMIGAPAGKAAVGVMAQSTWQPIYVNGQKVEMTAYNIAGNNYVKLRDIGQKVGFNVYWQDGVQVDTASPYTGIAPGTTATASPPASQTPTASSIRISSYKGTMLKVGDRSGLVIGPADGTYTVSSSNPTVADVENTSGGWVVAAKSGGTALITVVNSAGDMNGITITVESEWEPLSPGSASSLNAYMDIRKEMIHQINQVCKKNGVAELPVEQTLMDAAQKCAEQRFTSHDTRYECETAIACGYPYGFTANLTFMGNVSAKEAAQRAVTSWVNSPYHFQSMVSPRADSLGVGVELYGGNGYCYMLIGDSTAHNPYE